MATHPSRLSAMLILVLLVMVQAVAVSPLRGQHPRDEYDLAMFARPALPELTSDVKFPPGLIELWLKALERPDSELRRVVVDTLAIAHQRGLPRVTETQPRLIELLKTPDQSLEVSRAIVATLIEMDAQSYAAELAEVATTQGLPIAQIAEPALAKWKSTAMQQAWMQRVSDATAGDTMLVMAIAGLGSLQAKDATESLKKFVRDVNRSRQVRIESARALGNTHSSGLVEIANELQKGPSKVPGFNALLGVELLSKDDGKAATEILEKIVDGNNSAVQQRALGRLFEIDFRLVHRHVGELITSSDVNVRRWCAKSLLANRQLPDIGPLSGLLNDVNPSLRGEVSAGLLKLAEMEPLREEVIARADEVLGQNSWQGCEQAAKVLAVLDHKPAGPRLVELLGHPRGEVKVASAWALTQLRVGALLPDMLDHASSIFAGFDAGEINDSMRGMSLHVAHLFIAFGDQGFRDAEPLMQKYVPKNFDLGVDARTAAVWSIGMLHAGEATNEGLIKKFVARLLDSQSETPEFDQVRQMSAIGLGRMKAESALGPLRENARGQDPVSLGCHWAIEQITGESPPPLKPIARQIDDWVIAPIQN